MTKYYIGTSGDMEWKRTTAKTLRGAKRVAMMTCQQSAGGKITVGEEKGDDGYSYGKRIEPVAVRYGYDSWTDA